MHEIQETVKNAKDLTDEALIETVVASWEVVCAENEAHKELVTPGQFQQWTQFKNSTSLKMHEILDFSDGELSKENRDYLESMAGFIANATHKSEAEIIAENAKTEERTLADTRVTPDSTESHTNTLVQDSKVKAKKAGWMTRLKKLFSS